jgi:hypothetical protein
MNVGANDIDSVGVGEGGVSAFPGRDATSARTQGDGRGFYPGGSEAIEEIGFAGYFAVLNVGASEFAYIDLDEIRTRSTKRKKRGLQYLDSYKNQCNRNLHSHS